MTQRSDVSPEEKKDFIYYFFALCIFYAVDCVKIQDRLRKIYKHVQKTRISSNYKAPKSITPLYSGGNGHATSRKFSCIFTSEIFPPN